MNFTVTDSLGLADPTPATRTVTVTGAPTGGLVVAYAFGQGSGATTQDWSGNGNQGTLVGGVSWVAGQKGLGLSFDEPMTTSRRATRLTSRPGRSQRG